MKRIPFFSGATLMLLFIACGDPAEKKPEEASATETLTDAATAETPDSATMMKNWEVYMTPGPMHQMMASWEGTWEGQSSIWEGPDKPMQNYALTTVIKMILGGRYQVATSTGNMMGMPFEGVSTFAYDNHKKVFIGTWMDNLGTGLMSMEGTWDESTKTITSIGKMVDGGMATEIPIRELYKVVDADHHEMQMFTTYPGSTEEVKMMEIKWTRKK